MLIKFNTKDARVYNSELDAMEKKIERRLHRYFADDDTVCNVKFTEKKLEFKAELTLVYMGFQLRSETKDSSNFSAALDKGLDVMERQITKCKGKIEQKRQPAETPDVPGFEPEPEEYNVVKVKQYEMKPMTTQEAILNMNLLDHNFYTFFNSEYGKICTVYKRDDGNYGLIEPK
ncbi:MAG: ribosome-associated translation inhibitor RaiA [Clostridia bacterium]|jgi:putative sigma-54 modulation protein|nr:ribosome-associated translation inhibitor RaiA [Clostridia bacterium]